MQVQAQAMRNPTSWLTLWLLQGKPTRLTEERIRCLPVEVFRYLKAKQVQCQVTAHTRLHVQQLYEAADNRPNYLVALVTKYPNRRRNVIKQTDQQCHAQALNTTINQLLDAHESTITHRV